MIPQEQISKIVEALSEDPKKILDKFGIDYEESHNRLVFACPVHGGDNSTGACIFTDGDDACGNWVCWTRGCQDDYGKNILGFIQGILSCINDETVSFPQTISCAKSIVGNVDFSVSAKGKNRGDKSRVFDIFNKKIEDFELPNITREMVTKRLDIPSPYYLGQLTNSNIVKRRAYYQAETLNKFDVGDCMESGKPMAFRAVVPIYTRDGQYAGCTGRKIYENNEYPKWKNSAEKGVFSSLFYGFNHSKDDIESIMTVVIVEGQGDVWRCFESGAKNCIGLMGSSLSENQLLILESMYVENIVILTDFDNAGEEATNKIMTKCGRRFNYHRPKIPKTLMNDIKRFYNLTEEKADVSDLTNEEFQENIIDKLPKGVKVN
jgi:5S rRNA maturation endonuclease (ribonuclease M5)